MQTKRYRSRCGMRAGWQRILPRSTVTSGFPQLTQSPARRRCPMLSRRRDRRRATNCRELGLEFFLPLLQGLQPKLPAMKLDTELVDITCDFSALRFIL